MQYKCFPLQNLPPPLLVRSMYVQTALIHVCLCGRFICGACSTTLQQNSVQQLQQRRVGTLGIQWEYYLQTIYTTARRYWGFVGECVTDAVTYVQLSKTKYHYKSAHLAHDPAAFAASADAADSAIEINLIF